MSTENGRAQVFAISESGETVTIGGYASVFLDSVPLQHVANFVEHVGTNGKCGALQWSNEYVSMSITFRPASAVSKSAAAGKMFFIPKGAKVVLSEFRQIGFDSDNDGTRDASGYLSNLINDATGWTNCGDASITLSKDGPAEIQLELRHYLSEQTTIVNSIA